MIKKVTAALSVFAVGATIATQAFAAGTIGSACPTGTQFGGLCLGANQLGPVIGSIITLFFVLIGLAALWFLVLGGFKWLTSEGDKNNVEAARNQIMAAVVGLIVVFLAYLLVNALLGFATNGKVSLSNIQLPSLPQASQ